MKHAVLVCCIILFSFTVSGVGAHAQENKAYEDAYLAYEKGDIDESYVYLKRSLQQQPDHLPSKILMGQVLALSGFFSDAEIEFEEALYAGADPNLIVESFVRVLMLLKNYEKVVDIDEQQLTPNKLSFLQSGKGIAYSLLNEPEKALEFHEKAMKTAPNSPVVLNTAANFFIKNGSIIKAGEIIDRSMAVDNTIAETYHLKSKIKLAKNDVKQQIEFLKKGLEISSDHPGLLRDIVTAYTGLGDFENAKLMLQKTLADSPNDPMGRLLLSWVAARLNDNELADKTLTELVNALSLIDSEVLSDQVDILFVSALANLAANNLEIARGQLEQYLSRQPKNFDAAKLLADIYLREGSLVAAANLLENFFENITKDVNEIQNLCNIYIRAELNHKCDSLLNSSRDRFSNEDIFIQTESRLLAARGKLNLALESLEQLPQDSIATNAQKAVIAIRAKEFDKAESFIAALLKQYPENLDFLNLQASLFKQKNQLNQAEDVYRNILSINNRHYAAKFNLASILYSTNRLAEAKRLTSALIETRPTDVDLLILRGRVLTLNNDTEMALEILSTAETLRRNNSDASEAIIDLYLVTREYDKALTRTNTLLKNDLTNTRLLRLRAGILNELGRTDEAKQDLRVMFGLVSKSANQLYELSVTQGEFGDPEGALRSLQSALKLNPTDFFVNRDIARFALQLEQVELAKKHLSWLAKQAPTNPDVLLLSASIAFINQDLAKAAENFHNAVRASNSFAPALIGSYQLASKNIKTKEFVTLFEGLAKSPQQNTFATHLLADYYYNNKALEKAKVHYVAISAETNYIALPMVLNNLSNIYISEEKFDAAFNFAKQALEANPNNPYILDTVGWIHSMQGRYEQGLNLLRQAYSMNAQDPNLRYHIAYTLHKLNRLAESKRELKILLSDFDQFAKRQEALELQQSLN